MRPAQSVIKPACWQAALGLFFWGLINAANPASAFDLDRKKPFADELIAHLVAGDTVTISPAPGAPATCHSFLDLYTVGKPGLPANTSGVF